VVLLERTPFRYWRELWTIAEHLSRGRHCGVPDASPQTSWVVDVSEAELVFVACLYCFRHGGCFGLLILLFGVTGNVH